MGPGYTMLRPCFSIRRNGKYCNGWNLYLGILQIQENWAGRNFMTNSCVYSLLIMQALCRLKSKTTNGWRHFGQLEQRKSSVLFLIQSEKSPDSGFFTCDPTKKCIMPSSRERHKGIIGRGHDLRLVLKWIKACNRKLSWPISIAKEMYFQRKRQ